MPAPETEKYVVSTWLRLHKGGTKFYEVTYIVCPRTSYSVCIWRYGKVSMMAARGGGEVMIRANETWADFSKKKLAKGKEYIRIGAGPLRSLSDGDDLNGETMTDLELHRGLSHQFDDHVVARIIGVLATGKDEAVAFASEPDEIIVEEPPKTIAELRETRGESYGEWA
jgi:hypothetical protein